jgi:hypothetical protein
MNVYSPHQSLISLHIPKSGGTSFDTILNKWFSMGFHRHYYDHLKLKLPQKVKWGEMIKNMFPICVHGHFDAEVDKGNVFEYYPDAKQFITIYRDPLELQMSYYFYQKKLVREGASFWNGVQNKDDSFLGKDIDQHLEENSHNDWLRRFLPWEINLENYKDIIETNFIHIGITEDLQQSVNIFAEKLNKKPAKVLIENASVRTETPSESSVRIFKENNKLEYAFYEYACGLNKR